MSRHRKHNRREKRNSYSGQKEGKNLSGSRLVGAILIGAFLASLLTLLILGYINPEFSYFGSPVTGKVVTQIAESNRTNAEIEGLRESTESLKESIEELRETVRALSELLRIRDSAGNEIPMQITETSDGIEIVPSSGPVNRIVLYNVRTSNVSRSIALGIDDVAPTNGFSRVYAIDPTQLDFDNATVTVTAVGTELHKCKAWNFTTQTCFGNWTLFKTGLVPGQQYTFLLTPDDPGFGEFGESVGENSTTSTTYINKTVLTFTASEAGNYTIIVSSEIREDATNTEVSARLLLDGVDEGEMIYRPIVATGFESFSVHKTVNLSAGSHTATIQWKSGSGSVAALIRNARLIALKSDEVFYNSTDTTQTLNVGSFADVQTLTFTPPSAGTYLIMASAELAPDGLNDLANARFLVDGTEYSNFTYAKKAATNKKVYFTSVTLNLSASPHNLTMQGFANSGDTGKINRTRITAIRQQDQFIFANNQTSDIQSTTNTTTLQDAMTTVFTPTFTGEYLIFGTADIRQTTAAPQANGIRAVLEVDGVTYGNISMHPLDGSEWLSFASIQNLTLNASAHTIKIRFRALDGGTAQIKQMRVGITRTEQVNMRVFDLRPVSNVQFNVSDTIEIAANVTTDLIIQTVLANVTFPNGTVQQLTLTNTSALSGSGKFNTTFTVPSGLQGRYNISFIANDTLNNIGTNTTFFIANDTIRPRVIGLRPLNGTQFNVSETIEIAANVSDNGVLGAVRANVTFPNGTVQLLTLNNVSALANHSSPNNKFNTSFTIPNALKGNYNVTIIANDSNNNLNSTERIIFVAVDNIFPSVFDAKPVNGTEFNVASVIEIAANVSDNGVIGAVFVNITLPNGTINVLTLNNVSALVSHNSTTNKFNNSFTLYNITGRYNVTFVANDSSNNVNSTTTTFFIANDVTIPSVFDLRPVNNTSFNTSDVIEIAANVTDDVAVSAVRANITFPNGTVQQLTLTNVSGLLSLGGKFNTSFNIPNDLQGTYNITFIANDSSNSFNTTERTNFTVGDTINPRVFDFKPNGTPFNVSDTIEIAANVTDNGVISALLANITFPNGTSQLLTLANISGPLSNNTRFNTSFTLPNTPQGRYNITFIANDTNNNVNNTETTFFIANDTVRPSVFDLIPVAGTSFEVLSTIEIAANVTDNGVIQTVRALVQYPDGAINTLTLSNAVGDKYNTSFLVPNLIGRYNVTIVANDTNGNTNNTEKTHFFSGDFDPPSVIGLVPANGTTFNLLETLEIAANVTDDLSAVSQVLANVTLPNGTVQTLTLTNTSTTKYNTSFTIPIGLIGQYTVRIIANDTRGNVNSTETTTFIGADTQIPLVSSLVPVEDTDFGLTDTIEIAANVTDNGVLSFVSVTIVYPDGAVNTLVLNNSVGDKFNASFTIPNILGRYNLTFFANDTDDNVNNTETTFFNAGDTRNPSVTLLSPQNGTSFNVSDVVEIAANVTDNLDLQTVRVNLTLPNGTVNVLTLSQFNSTDKFNVSFTIPNELQGQYNITFIANDSTGNTNATTITNFIAGDTVNPRVVSVHPPEGLNVMASQVIEIAANVTDNGVIDTVLANISLPNGTVNVLTLTNVSGSLIGGGKFNTSFTVPSLVGQYNITFIANDTNNNVNSTTTTFLLQGDATPPNVIIVTPVNGTQFNVSDTIEIAANVTDNGAVAAVSVNVTFPNGTVQNLTLSNVGNSKYNRSFTLPNTPQGRYNITFIATDTSDNVNSTETTFFIANDTVRPAVFGLKPLNGTSFTVGDTIEIAANVTDNGVISTVIANITFPNGTAELLTLANVTGNKFNASFTAPGEGGFYTVRFLANDTNNNLNNTEIIIFEVTDNESPLVFSLIPSAGTNFLTNATIEIAANITDLSSISANVTVTYPDGATITLSLVNPNGDKFNTSFTIPNIEGRYNLSYFAQDTIGNINNTETTFFIAGDAFAPLVINATPTNGTVFNVSDVVEISANVTDSDSNVSFVSANLTLPNGTVNVLTLTNVSGPLANGGKFNTSFTIPNNLQGRYNITFIANDTRNNVNSTVTTFFIANDTIRPSVASLVPPNSSAFPSLSVIEIAANVTDNGVIDKVLAKIDYPDGASNTLTLVSVGGDKFNVSFTIPSVTGRYNVTFIANDTNNNVNNTETTFFIGGDTVRPLVFDLRPVSGFNASNLSVIEISANVTDNFEINTVLANVTLPNGTINVLTLNQVTGTDKFNQSFSIPNLKGTYNVTFIANDTSNNLNSTERTNFTFDGVSNATLSTDKTEYFQGTAATAEENPNFGVKVFILFEASYVNPINSAPIVDGTCNVTSNNSNSVTTLTFNSTTGNYSGSLDNTIEFDITNYTLSCSSPSMNAASSSTVASTFWLNYIINTGNIFFGGTDNNLSSSTTWLSKVAPNSTSYVNKTFNMSISPNQTDVNGLRIFFCGSNTNVPCSFLRNFNMQGIVTMRANLSASANNVCKPKLCYHLSTSNLEDTYELCGEPSGSLTTTPTLFEQNATLDGVTIGKTNFLSMHIHCDADSSLSSTTNVSVNLFYNYSDQEVNLEIHHPEPLNVITEIIENKQESFNLTIGPDQTLNVTVNHTILLNNTSANSGRINLFQALEVLGRFGQRVIANKTRVYNSTGGFWASDNVSLMPLENLTVFTGNVINYRTEFIGGSSAINNTARVEYQNALIDNETFTLNETTVKRWRVDLETIFVQTGSIRNITVFTNYSTYLPEGDEEARFTVNFTNSSGTFDLTNDTVVNTTLKTLTFPPISASLVNFTVEATDVVAPRLSGLVPANNSSFTSSATIEIAANLTEQFSGVDSVSANITLPNGTVQVLTLTNVSGPLINGGKFNTSFTLPSGLEGTYSARFIANDTAGNVNSTETTSFNVADTTSPLVFDFRPVSNSSFNVSDTIEVAVNVTDNVAISKVLANVTLPNGTVQVLNLTNVLGDKFNTSFTLPNTPQGQYNITYIANDTANNVNSTETTFFVAGDTIKPEVFDVRPVNGSQFDVADVIEISANVTDNGVISAVVANLTLPNGTLQTLTLANVSGDKFNASFTIPDLAGRYNLTYIANDTNNNVNSSVTSFFEVNDTSAPQVSGFIPSAGTNFTSLTSIEVAANVTDNAAVSFVSATVTYPDGATVDLTLVNAAGNKYNASLSIPNIGGRYNVSFFANDTSNNINNTETTFFEVGDVFAPSIIITSPSDGALFNVSDVIEISANVSDGNSNLSAVIANVTFPNGTVQQLTLTNVSAITNHSAANKFNVSFTIPNALQGRYNITFIANDTLNNLGTNTTFFTANDTIRPSVAALVPPNGTTFGSLDVIEIAANVTDNGVISTVRAQIKYPNGATNTLTLTNVGGDKFNTSFTVPDIDGRFNVTFIANDTNNNVNNTETTFFIGGDQARPSVLDIKPVNGTAFNVSDVVEISANVTDDFAVSAVKANVTLPNGTVQVLNLTNVLGDKFNASFTIPQALQGRYNITFIANDSSNNLNSTETTFFIANDTVKPAAFGAIPAAGTSFNSSDVIEIAVNATDNGVISSVIANLTLSNGTSQLLTLTSVGGDKFNVSFTIPNTPQGQYNLTFLVNDTNNNLNSSITTNFIVGDTINPAVFGAVPANGTSFNVSDVIEIAVNATDNGVLGTVLVNATLPNGTVQQLTLTNVTGDKFNTSFTIPSTPQGQYNLTFIANDTNNNVNSSTTTTFIVGDTIRPAVFELLPTNGSSFNTSDIIEVSANVTDNGVISAVIANVTLPNGTVNVLTLSQISGTDKFNTSFTIPVLQGTYNVTIIANDTNNNVNSSEKTFFTVADTLVPAVSGVIPANGTSFNVSDTIEIGVNVTDNVAVSSVTANVTLPNGTVNVLTLSLANGSRYNVSFTIPNDLQGQYNVTFIANDSNNNVNSTVVTVFTVGDTINPAVFDSRPINGSSFNIADIVEIAANITDNGVISAAIVNVTLPNGTVQQLTLTNATGDKFNVSFTVPNLAGRYNLTYIANDTNNNVNSSVTSFFNANDTLAPRVFSLIPVNGSHFAATSVIEIAANVTDNVAVSTVSVTVTYPDGAFEEFALVNAGGDKYNASFTIPDFGGRYNVSFFANDSSNNVNNTERTFFNVSDIFGPSIDIVSPNAGATFNVSDVVEIAANISDLSSNISAVLANVTFPNGTVQQLTLTNVSAITNHSAANKFNVSFTIPNTPQGRYNLTFIANDTKNNVNSSVTTFFIANDTIKPSVFGFIPPNDTTFPTLVSIEIATNVTDNGVVDTVKAQLKYPNGATNNLVLTNVGGDKYNTSFSIPNIAGRYNVTFIANDTNNNVNNTETTFFIGGDTTKPLVVGLVPVAGTQFNASDTVELAANVTDNFGVSSVRANVTFPNGTVQQLNLSLATGSKYNASFTLPNTPQGRYNITFIANDTSNNVNSTETTFFISNDTVRPAVFGAVPANGTSFNASDVIEIAINATDNGVISSAIANITFSNGTSQLVTLASVVGDKFNSSFTIPNTPQGQYNLTFLVNDTNGNLNSTTITTFIVGDTINPAVSGLLPVNGSVFNTSQVVEIAANVTDNGVIDAVLANVTLPNGTVNVLTLSQVGSTPKFNNSFIVPSGIQGTYNITYIANDTNNNVNSTARTSFIGGDSEKPSVSGLIPVANSTFSVAQNIEIAANVTDNIAVSDVRVNLTLPNGTLQVLTLINVSGPLANGGKFNTSFSIPNLPGTYNITFTANDTTNNVNSTSTTFFVLANEVNPNVTIVSPASGNFTNATLLVNITAVDDNAVENVLFFNGTANQTYASPVFVTFPQGTTVMRVYANDTFGNLNDTESVTIFIDSVPPSVTGVASTKASINQTQETTIVATVSDATTSVDKVIAQFTLPNGTVQNQTMALSGATYTTIFATSSSNVPGVYNVTIIANDTFGNVNSSEKTNFTVNDITRPQVTINSPSAGNFTNATILVNITATDNFQVSTILFFNGTANQTYTSPVFVTFPEGTTVVSVFVNDTSGNVNNPENVTINVDTTPLSVFDLRPVNGTQFNVSDVVEISANVTNSGQINSVKANLTLPNGTVQVLTLTNTTGDKFNTSFIIPNALQGRYNLTFVANDSFGNVNGTGTTFFIANDTAKPAVFGFIPSNGSSFNVSDVIEIAVNATDNGVLGTVLVNVTLPNGTVQQLTLTNVTGDKFNTSFTIPSTPQGQYNLTFIVNDTNNNVNVTTTSFIVGDTIKPSVFGLVPTNGSGFNLSQTIEIAANATDNDGPVTVIVNITLPNGTVQQLTLTNVTGNKFNTSFVVPSSLIGRYNITYIANDTNNNANSTSTTFFNALDVINPNVTGLVPLNGSTFNLGSTIEIAANVTDNVAVSSVLATITYPDGATNTLTLNNTSGNKFNASFSVPSDLQGRYNVTIVANDTSNNLNNTEKTHFIVSELNNPSVTITSPTNGSTFRVNDTVGVTALVTDSTGVDTVLVRITFPNGSTTDLQTSNISASYNTTFSDLDQKGTYLVRIIANDTLNNVNNATTVIFTRVVEGNRTFDVVNPAGDSINNAQVVILNSSGILTVTVNLTNQTISSLIVSGYSETSPYALIKIANRTNDSSLFAQTYGIDPSGLNFTSINLTAVANGTVLYKCENFTISTTTCNDGYSFVRNLTPGETYTITINNATDPGFSEQNPTNGTPDQGSYDPFGEGHSEVVNTFAATQANDQVYFAVRRNNGAGAQNDLNTHLNLTYNLSGVLSGASASDITNMTFLLEHCLNDDSTGAFTCGGSAPGGVAENSTAIELFNWTAGAFQQVGTYNGSIINEGNATTSLGGSFVDFVNSTTKLVQIRYKINVTITTNGNDAAFGADFAQLTVTFGSVIPKVENLRPVANSSFNTSNVIEIAANVTTVFANVSSVRANVTFPNGTVQQLTLTNVSGPATSSGKFNASFAIPELLGRYNVSFFANDSSGSVNNSETTFFNASDGTKPVVFDLRPLNGSFFALSSVIEVAANVTDNIAVNNVIARIRYPDNAVNEFNLTNVAGNKYNTTFTLPPQNGTYNLTVIANDTSGNTNESSILFFVDSAAPTVTIIHPTTATFNNRTLLVNISATDSGAGVSTIFFDWNGTNTTYTSPVIVNFTEGSITLKAYANDTVGNLGSATVTFTVDVTAPTVTIVSPENKTYNNATILVNLTTTNGPNGTVDTVRYNWNGTFAVYNTTHFVTFPEGSITLNATVNDTAGNSGNATRVFTVDTIKPNVTIHSPENITYSSQSILVNLSATDNGSGVNTIFYNFNGTNITYTSPVNVTFPEGSTTLIAFANDSAGNLDSKNVTFSVVLPAAPAPSGGGGGGGGGGAVVTPVCEEDWICTEWSACSGGLRSRFCSDQNNCGTTDDRPALDEECEVAAPVSFCKDNKLNQDESDVDCGGKTCSERCDNGKRCYLNSDCKSQNCENGVCMTPTPAPVVEKKEIPWEMILWTALILFLVLLLIIAWRRRKHDEFVITRYLERTDGWIFGVIRKHYDVPFKNYFDRLGESISRTISFKTNYYHERVKRPVFYGERGQLGSGSYVHVNELPLKNEQNKPKFSEKWLDLSSAKSQFELEQLQKSLSNKSLVKQKVPYSLSTRNNNLDKELNSYLNSRKRTQIISSIVEIGEKIFSSRNEEYREIKIKPHKPLSPSKISERKAPLFEKEFKFNFKKQDSKLSPIVEPSFVEDPVSEKFRRSGARIRKEFTSLWDGLKDRSKLDKDLERYLKKGPSGELKIVKPSGGIGPAIMDPIMKPRERSQIVSFSQRNEGVPIPRRGWFAADKYKGISSLVREERERYLKSRERAIQLSVQPSKISGLAAKVDKAFRLEKILPAPVSILNKTAGEIKAVYSKPVERAVIGAKDATRIRSVFSGSAKSNVKMVSKKKESQKKSIGDNSAAVREWMLGELKGVYD